MGGRLVFFVDGWRNVTSDQWVIRLISEGLRIDFVSNPVQSIFPTSVAMSKEMQAICDKEVDDLLAKKAIIEIKEVARFR